MGQRCIIILDSALLVPYPHPGHSHIDNSKDDPQIPLAKLAKVQLSPASFFSRISEITVVVSGTDPLNCSTSAQSLYMLPPYPEFCICGFNQLGILECVCWSLSCSDSL